MIKKFFSIFILGIILIACSRQSSRMAIVATSPPISFIIHEIAGTAADVVNLLPPGVSPHTYSPGPNAVSMTEQSLALFYVSPLLDGWAAKLPAKNKIMLLKLLPLSFQLPFNNTNVQEIDPHFWTDPLTVVALVPAIAETLSVLDPKNELLYKTNAKNFVTKLENFDKQLNQMMLPIAGKYVVLFHPSFRYFINRYGLVYAGSVETSPGKEPTPKYLADLINTIKKDSIKAIFSETELPEISAKAIAEAANVRLYNLDPMGGAEGINDYFDLMLFNAKIFLTALK